MTDGSNPTRRAFLVSGTAAIGAAAVGMNGILAWAADKPDSPATQPGPNNDVSPTEDLMREHGLLRRILLVWDNASARLAGGTDLPMDQLAAAATLVKKVIQDYHEKLEEEFVFPLVGKLKPHADLVKVLLRQHEVGRKAMAEIAKLLGTATKISDDGRKSLKGLLDGFARMYRAHASREDTVIFPAFHQSVPPKEFDLLGDKFEDRETEVLGKEGFEKSLVKVEEIEKAFRLESLDGFTLKI